jgi:nucleoside-diphosphate-sugar epimerase
MIHVVIGARRGVGLELVKTLLQDEQKQIRCVIRDTSDVLPAELMHARCQLFRTASNGGLDDDTMRAAFASARVVYFAASASARGSAEVRAVDLDSARRAAEAASAAGVNRFVLVSSQLVHPTNTCNLIRCLINSCTTGLCAWGDDSLFNIKWRGEEAVRHVLAASSTAFTIVRPGQLVDGLAGSVGAPRAGQSNASFMRGAASTRADVAAVCIAAAATPICANATFEMACDKAAVGGEESKLLSGDLFSALRPDSEWLTDA